MHKFVKNEKVPFEELSISKQATMEQILKNASEFYGQSNTKKTRLIMNDELITGLKL